MIIIPILLITLIIYFTVTFMEMVLLIFIDDYPQYFRYTLKVDDIPLLWPYHLILIIIDQFKKLNKYLNKNKLKQMNFKILGKAMSFMFLPTLGVLLMLLVGFFDPIVLWTWIKSDSGGAVFTRIFIFLLETGLVTALYFHYLKEEIKNEVINGNIEGKSEEIYYNKNLYRIYPDEKSDSYYKFYIIDTKDSNIKIIERKLK